MNKFDEISIVAWHECEGEVYNEELLRKLEVLKKANRRSRKSITKNKST